jgi:hypothetical protein
MRYDENGGEASISGNVVELFDQETIENATITAGMYSTTTDSEGNYSLDLYPGEYSIFCEADGFALASSNDVILSDNDNMTIDFELWEISYSPQNVIAIELDNGNSQVIWDPPQFQSRERDLVSYSIDRIRLDEEFNILSTENAASGITSTSHEDMQWPILDAGIYKYIVSANYSSGGTSPGSKSDIIFNKMTADVTLNIYTNNQEEPDGALIELHNLNQNPQYQYSVYADSSTIILPEIWKGTYIITVSKTGYDTFEITEQEIFDDIEIATLLNETLQKVEGVGVFDYILEWGKVDIDRCFSEYRIYLDNFQTPHAVTNVHSYDLSEFGNDFHEVGVQAIFTTGESDIFAIAYENGESLPIGKISEYSFDNPEEPYSDVLGNYDGFPTGNVSLVGSEIGGSCISLDGSAETYVDCGDIEELDGVSQYSMGGWFYLNEWLQWRKMITKDAKIGIITIDNNNVGKLQACQRNPENSMRGDSESLFRLNEWHHIFTTFDGTQPDNQSRLKLYVDGIELDLEFYDEIPTLTSPDLENFWIGGFTTNSINGKVDDVGVWDRAITKKEIQHLYLNSVPYWSSIEGNVSFGSDIHIEDAFISTGMFDTYSDDLGNFYIELPATRYNVTCTSEGQYPLMEENIKVLSNESFVLDFIYPTVDSNNSSLIEDKIILHTNYPNPFKPSMNNRNSFTTFSFSIPDKSVISLEIFNLKGQKVNSLGNQDFDRGTHSLVWDGRDISGKYTSTGVYMYRLIVNGKSEKIRKCLLLK